LSEITADFIVIDLVVHTKTIICLFEREFRPISPVVYNSGTIYHKVRKNAKMSKNNAIHFCIVYDPWKICFIFSFM